MLGEKDKILKVLGITLTVFFLFVFWSLSLVFSPFCFLLNLAETWLNNASVCGRKERET